MGNLCVESWRQIVITRRLSWPGTPLEVSAKVLYLNSRNEEPFCFL